MNHDTKGNTNDDNNSNNGLNFGEETQRETAMISTNKTTTGDLESDKEKNNDIQIDGEIEDNNFNTEMIALNQSVVLPRPRLASSSSLQSSGINIDNKSLTQQAVIGRYNDVDRVSAETKHLRQVNTQLHKKIAVLQNNILNLEKAKIETLKCVTVEFDKMRNLIRQLNNKEIK